jgi:hypothetical protein
MTSISVEQLTFTFDPSVVPFQYEKDSVCVTGWPQGSKVVDVVAHDLRKRSGGVTARGELCLC